MFFKYLEPALAPFRKLRNRITKVKQVKGNVKMDVKRVKNLKNQNIARAKEAQEQANKLKGQAAGAKGKVAGVKGNVPGGGGGGGGGGGNGAAINPKPGVKTVGFFRKKLICEQCGQQLDKSWDGCPYCAQAAADAAPAPSTKTQAFMIDPGGGGGSMQLLGWLVPVQGPQRGELFTLAPHSTIGTDPASTVVLIDQYMSSNHAEIKAEGGTWVLIDLGSTNGTFVNDKRVDKQELVDNDFVKFGQSLVKFKSL